MNFLNPLVLLGLVAAAIPLILHLLNLRKLKLIEFSSLKFVKEMQKTKIRRLKLKQILLLILRILIIVFIVLAFARPTVNTNLPVIGTYANSDIVILLDNSFSMDVSDEYGNRMTQARNIVNDIIGKMIDGDNAMIVPLAHQGIYNFEFSSSKTSLQQDLYKINISSFTSSVDDALRFAYSSLDKGINIRKEIFIISDAGPNIFLKKIKDEIKYNYPNCNVNFIPVGYDSKSDFKNLSIDSLSFVTRIIQQDKPVEIKASIRNHSSGDVYGLVASLYFKGNRVAQRPVDIQAGMSKDITISAPAGSTGLIEAYIEIENDDLDYDNRRYFAFSTPDMPKIAAFGSQQSLFPLNLILSGAGADLSEYSAVQIQSIDFSKFDVVIFADGPYTSLDFSKALTYVQNGGSVLLFADNSNTEPILYVGLEKLGFSGATRVNLVGRQTSFDYTDKQHPIFEGVFKGNTDSKKVIESPSISRMFPPVGGQKIITTPSGTFLAESRQGSGKAFYISVNLSSEWSNFTRTGIFPVIIYRSVIYLSSKETIGQSFTISEPVRMTLPGKNKIDENFKVIDPNKRDSYTRSIGSSQQSVIEINNDLPGTYSIFNTQNNLAGFLSLNYNPSESEKPKADKKFITESLEKMIHTGNEIHIIEPANLSKDISRARTGSELWQFFVLLAILAALAEMFVARKAKNEN